MDGMSVDSVMSTGMSSVSQAEKDLASAQSSAKSGSASDMLALEQKEQTWSIAVQMDSTLVKSVASTVKSVIRGMDG